MFSWHPFMRRSKPMTKGAFGIGKSAPHRKYAHERRRKQIDSASRKRNRL